MANRGASGIDGLVSTALGVSVAGSGPVVALLGDLSFLHDAGAILWNATRGVDLTVVVVNNGGGHVFSLLPQRELPEHRELFVTPHAVDIGRLCEAAGAGHERVERASDLLPALDRAAGAGGGIRVVEVVVDAELGLRRREELRGAVDAALSDGRDRAVVRLRRRPRTSRSSPDCGTSSTPSRRTASPSLPRRTASGSRAFADAGARLRGLAGVGRPRRRSPRGRDVAAHGAPGARSREASRPDRVPDQRLRRARASQRGRGRADAGSRHRVVPAGRVLGRDRVADGAVATVLRARRLRRDPTSRS